MKQVGEIVAGGELSSASGQRHGEARLPHLIAQESPRTQERYLEFFAVTIRNPHTRRAYVAAASRFFAWVETRAPRLASVTPMLVAAYIESHPGEALTIRQHLAALRRLFDWLVTGGSLPACAIRRFFPSCCLVSPALALLSPCRAAPIAPLHKMAARRCGSAKKAAKSASSRSTRKPPPLSIPGLPLPDRRRPMTRFFRPSTRPPTH